MTGPACRILRRSQERCWAKYLFISNMLTLLLPPKMAWSFSSARISRLFSGFCRLLALMYSHTLLTTSVRGSGEEPTTAASSFEGCSGFIRAGFGFLVAVVPALSVVDAAIVNLPCYVPQSLVTARCRDYSVQ